MDFQDFCGKRFMMLAGRNTKKYAAFLTSIEDCTMHFPELQALIVEVSERRKGSIREKHDQGTICDFAILKNQ